MRYRLDGLGTGCATTNQTETPDRALGLLLRRSRERLGALATDESNDLLCEAIAGRAILEIKKSSIPRLATLVEDWSAVAIRLPNRWHCEPGLPAGSVHQPDVPQDEA